MTGRCSLCRRPPGAAATRCGSRCAAARRPRGTPTTPPILSRCSILTGPRRSARRASRSRSSLPRPTPRPRTARCTAATPPPRCRPRSPSRRASSALNRTRTRRRRPRNQPRRPDRKRRGTPASAVPGPWSRPPRRTKHLCPTSRRAAPPHRRCWTMTSPTSPRILTPPPSPPRRLPMTPPRPRARAPAWRTLPALRPSCLTPAPLRRPPQKRPRRKPTKGAAARPKSPRASRCSPASRTAALRSLKRASAAADAPLFWGLSCWRWCLCWAAGRCGCSCAAIWAHAPRPKATVRRSTIRPPRATWARRWSAAPASSAIWAGPG